MTRRAEQRLIERAARGDKASADALIRAHQASLFAYMLRMSGRPDVAEDIVQDAFVRVLTHLDAFNPRFRFSTWLFTIAKRLYVNSRQKLAPRYDSEAVGGWGGADKSERIDEPAQHETGVRARGALQTALDELNEDQREIIVLFHQQSWPIALIAQHKRMPEGTVKSHLHRARQRMRRTLEASTESMAAVSEVIG